MMIEEDTPKIIAKIFLVFGVIYIAVLVLVIIWILVNR
jgi:hypothetical protein